MNCESCNIYCVYSAPPPLSSPPSFPPTHTHAMQVFSNLWLNDAFFGSPPVNAILSAVYAPPRDGAVSVVVASLAPFAEASSSSPPAATAAAAAAAAAAARSGGGAIGGNSGKNGNGNGNGDDDDDDNLRFRFYARGLFASTFVARCAPGNHGDGGGIAGGLRECAWNAHLGLWGLGTLACSLLVRGGGRGTDIEDTSDDLFHAHTHTRTHYVCDTNKQ